MSSMSKSEAERILGLSPLESYTYDVFNKHYRKLAKENHPDRGGDPESMVEINAAHATLVKLFTDKTATVIPNARSTTHAHKNAQTNSYGKQDHSNASSAHHADSYGKQDRADMPNASHAAQEACKQTEDQKKVWEDQKKQAPQNTYEEQYQQAYKKAHEQTQREKAWKEAKEERKAKAPEHFDWGEDIYTEKGKARNATKTECEGPRNSTTAACGIAVKIFLIIAGIALLIYVEELYTMDFFSTGGFLGNVFRIVVTAITQHLQM